MNSNCIEAHINSFALKQYNHYYDMIKSMYNDLLTKGCCQLVDDPNINSLKKELEHLLGKQIIIDGKQIILGKPLSVNKKNENRVDDIINEYVMSDYKELVTKASNKYLSRKTYIRKLMKHIGDPNNGSYAHKEVHIYPEYIEEEKIVLPCLAKIYNVNEIKTAYTPQPGFEDHDWFVLKLGYELNHNELEIKRLERELKQRKSKRN